MPQFTPQNIRQILSKHGLPCLLSEEIIKGEFEGVVNEVWFAGKLVIRINKNLDYESDVLTESVAVPALTRHEILTPNLLVFDQDLDIVDRLITIYDRVPGQSLSRISELDDPHSFFKKLGQEVRRFHDAVETIDDPDNLLDPAWTIDLAKLRNQCLEQLGQVPAWIGDEPLPTKPKVLCHQDLHADNILVHEGKLAAIIDWGDAGWAHPMTDLRFIPARYLPATLEGYGEIDARSRRLLAVHQLDQFLYCQRESRSYGPICDSSIEDVLEVCLRTAEE